MELFSSFDTVITSFWVWLVFFCFTDLRTMTDRLKSGYFSSKKLFIADMMRIFTNCRTYNAPETEYYKCANTVERFFLSKVKELRKTNWAPMSHHLSTPELIFKKWNFSFAIKTISSKQPRRKNGFVLILCTNLNQRLPTARREHCQIDRRSCRFFFGNTLSLKEQYLVPRISLLLASEDVKWYERRRSTRLNLDTKKMDERMELKMNRKKKKPRV